MIPLAVPVPQLSWPSGRPSPELENLVEVRLAAIRYQDGGEAINDQVQKLGAFVSRVAGGPEEVWNENEQSWWAVPVDLAGWDPLTLLPFTYKAGDPAPWQGVLVAAGQKDKQGNPRYEAASGGQPRYRLRAYAKLNRDGAEYAGISAPTPAITFEKLADIQRFTIRLAPSSVETCETARITLRNGSLIEAGYLEVRAVAGQQEVEIANCDAAGIPFVRVVLTSAGDVHLRPAAGRKLIVDGDIDVEGIRYRSAFSGTKVDLT